MIRDTLDLTLLLNFLPILTPILNSFLTPNSFTSAPASTNVTIFPSLPATPIASPPLLQLPQPFFLNYETMVEPLTTSMEPSKLMFLSHLLASFLSICLCEGFSITTGLTEEMTTRQNHVHSHGHSHGHLHRSTNFLTCYQSDNHSTSLYDYKSYDIHGVEEIPLSVYRNKVLLIMNVASF